VQNSKSYSYGLTNLFENVAKRSTTTSKFRISHLKVIQFCFCYLDWLDIVISEINCGEDTTVTAAVFVGEFDIEESCLDTAHPKMPIFYALELLSNQNHPKPPFCLSELDGY
jgi:hypothetical protein